MIVDEARFGAIVESVFAAWPARAREVTPAEAYAIARLLYLAIEVDLHEDTDELALFDSLATSVGSLAGLRVIERPPLPQIPIDAEERAIVLAGQVAQLRGPSRDLAYALASLLVVSDLAFAPIESTFLDELGDALAIPETRAADLAASAAEIVTPGESASDAADLHPR